MAAAAAPATATSSNPWPLGRASDLPPGLNEGDAAGNGTGGFGKSAGDAVGGVESMMDRIAGERIYSNALLVERDFCDEMRKGFWD